MEKLFEKKNLGIPVTLMTLIAYMIGYYMSNDYRGLFVGVLFAGVVFIFDFDDKVKNAVKQSYFIAMIFCLMSMAIHLLFQLSELTAPIYILQTMLSNVYQYVSCLFNIVVIIIYILLIIAVLFKKDLHLRLVLNIFDENKKSSKDKQNSNQFFPQMLVENSPGQHMTEQQVPGQQVPGQLVLGQHASGQHMTGQQNSDQQNSGQQNSDQQNSGQQNSDQQNSGQQNSDQQNSDQHNSGQQNSSQQKKEKQFKDELIFGKQMPVQQIPIHEKQSYCYQSFQPEAPETKDCKDNSNYNENTDSIENRSSTKQSKDQQDKEVIICSECGAINHTGTLFCTTCGTLI